MEGRASRRGRSALHELWLVPIMKAKINKSAAIAQKKQGTSVFEGGAPLKASVVRATIEEVRKERERQLLGKKWITCHKSE